MDSNDHSSLLEGTVYRKTIGIYEVRQNGRVLPCSISNKLRKQLIFPTADPHSIRRHVVDVKKIATIDPVAIGDRVAFVDAQDGTGVIHEILPRDSKLVRRSAVPMPGAHPFEQIIVANVDLVAPVMAAAQPAPKWNLLDRYLVSAESSGLHAVIVVTKMDLLTDLERKEIEMELDIYRRAGYPVILTSAVTAEGLTALREAMHEKMTVFMGKSGVGKTSLLNAIQPGLGLRVNEVNDKTGKGKHTTTFLEMFSLDFGGSLVDTPGMREFGLWEIDGSELAEYFPEISPFIGRCRFGLGCSHDHEPGCAVRRAVMQGEVSEQRYRSYLLLREEL